MTYKKKGYNPWNKGLTKEIDERVRNYSLKLNGRKKSEESIEKRRKKMIGHIVTEETKRKMSVAKLGKKKTELHRRNISLSRKGKLFSKKQKENMSKSWDYNKHFTKETKEKISNKMKERIKNGWIHPKKGKHLSNKIKTKMRISAFNYVKNRCSILFPCIGHNEKQILDKLENKLNYKILRQYKCEGYFIDGYIPELNIVIEIDEKPKIKEKDIEREGIIKQKLNCKFVRIKDYD